MAVLGNTRSAGRVQTPTLALVVERERERLAFKPEDYWVISGVAAQKMMRKATFKMVRRPRVLGSGEADAAYAVVRIKCRQRSSR